LPRAAKAASLRRPSVNARITCAALPLCWPFYYSQPPPGPRGKEDRRFEAGRPRYGRKHGRGLEFVGLADRRPKDKFGIAAAYSHISPRARALDLDFRSLLTPWPSRSSEGLITAVYQYELRAGWTLQPNFQFIVRPGGGATNPLSALPGKALKNAEVFGLRTVLKF
jgi:hypothetical protein